MLIIGALSPLCGVDSPIDAAIPWCYPSFVLVIISLQGVRTMEWVTPQHEEVNLNCEISSYANAEL
jgi:hypothetical protein